MGHTSFFQLLLDGAYGIFLQPAHLRLRDADLGGHLHLGLALTEPQGQNVPLTGLQVGDGVLQRQLLQPALIAAVVVPDLIHDAHGVPAVGVHRLIQRHRG